MANVSSSNGIEKYPKLRFQGFTIPWTEIEIGKAFQVTRGYVLPATVVRQDASEEYIYPVYSSQTKDNGLMGYYNDYLYENAITWTTDGANAGTVHYRSGKFYCTNVCGVLLSDEGNANRCVAEILGSVSKKYVSYVGNPKLMNNVMSEIKIYVPTIAEQKKIDDFISVIDHRIEKQHELIEYLKKYKRGVIQAVFDDEKRELFGEISSGKRVKLSDLMDFQNGINADASKYGRGIRYISVSDILKNNFITYDKIIGQVDIDSRALATYSVTYGDVLFQRSSETREDAGRSNVYLDTEKTASFGGFVIRGKKRSDYDPLYLKYALDSFVVRKQIMQCAAGAQHINVSQEDLCNVVVNLPTIDVQNRISKLISDIDLRITIEEKKANAQVTLKKALLQQLFI